ncbi:unnamed protein product (macronuclear) [Paramecium tetraurelia]|uniref:Uncharacterized protein n=1 Tax=Paramecium tetraurelia TaxID=5888 RepID=A0DZI0_PARTE|nr:uncharacterized protein GSPATT00021614001 [Paramecium tetraurelia]CAK88447.1 unnamed protein product [Paramecium tetraurelia]|eukprot:XP_001455844.1 hypothetical protein (macronuclear) [Paramecium tetraurelia strain d4-2]
MYKDIDELLEQIELNNDIKTQSTRERNRRSFVDPPKLETQKIANDPYEFDSILKSQDSPVDRQSSFVPRQRPQTAVIDESKKQKMADLFQLPKTIVNKDLPPPPPQIEDTSNNMEVSMGQSRRQKMRMLSQNKGQPQKSDINSSQDPIANNTQQIEVEKQSVQSDYSIKQSKQPEIQLSAPVNLNVQKFQDEIKQLKQEKDRLQDDLQALRNDKQKLQDEIEIEKRERQRIINEKLEAERSFIKEREQLKNDYERDKQRAVDAVKLENEIMRQQLGEQRQLDHLADKIKDSAKELETLKNQLYQKHEQQAQEKIRLFEKKQKCEINDQETSLEKEKSYVESEKRRLQNIQDDISRREQLFQASMEGDKRSLQSEKQLLQDIKESLRTLEIETKKRLEQESMFIQRQKNELELLKNEMNSQAQNKLRQLDLEKQLFEQQKNEYHEFTQKNNQIIQQKYSDIEKQQQKNGAKEMQLIALQRDLDMKSNQVTSLHAEYSRKLGLVDGERQQLLQKLKEINEKEQLYHKEISNVQEFRQIYQQEKETIQKQKLELHQQLTLNQQEKIQIEQEKNQLTQMHKTLSHLRSEIAQNSTQGFSQTTAFPAKPVQKNKVEKPKSAQKIPIHNNSSANQTASNFDVGSYMKYLKNVDYLH